MSGDKGAPPTGKDLARAKREERLAQALRRNLKRRKVVAKAESEAPPAKVPTK